MGMCCTFAALLLHDEGVEVNAANLKKVVDASGNKVAAYWQMLFANALVGQNMGDFCAVSGGSAPAPATTTTAAPAEKKEEAKKEEEKVEEEEEDMDFGDLFG